MTAPRPDHEPYICLCSALSMAGNELIEMAGAVNERREANDHKLDRAARAASKVVEAIAEYHRRTDPVIDWPRPSCDRKDTGLRYGDGMRAEDMLEGHGDD